MNVSLGQESDGTVQKSEAAISPIKLFQLLKILDFIPRATECHRKSVSTNNIDQVCMFKSPFLLIRCKISVVIVQVERSKFEKYSRG